jgi:dihydropyrimidine dehydrogenase (NAD+) subunit PreA
MPLTIEFAGLVLKSPIIAASAPPTESAAAIRSCARAGAGAAITKSIVDYRRTDWPDVPRRVRRDRRGHSIQGSFSSETLTLEEGRHLVSDAKCSTDIPVIASVGVLDATSPATLETAARLIEAGADMIHFDLFYLPQPRASDASIAALNALFEAARLTLSAPFGAKLNLDIPAHTVAHLLSPDKCDAWFALDSIRVPPPLDSRGGAAIPNLVGALECSLFGGWQKPLTLQYTRVLRDAGFHNLCIGGGLQGVDDVIEAVMMGATSVQVATQIMVHGFDWITRTNDQLEAAMAERGECDLSALNGRAIRLRDAVGLEQARTVVAVVDHDRCKPCGVCTKIVFCPFIHETAGGRPLIDQDCYGCGFCESLCPLPGAIRMEPVE